MGRKQRDLHERRQERYDAAWSTCFIYVLAGAFASWTSHKVSGCERAVL